MADRIDVRLQMEKTTKNTVKFIEVLDSELDAPKIGTLYIQKATLKAMDWHDGDVIVAGLSIEKA